MAGPASLFVGDGGQEDRTPWWLVGLGLLLVVGAGSLIASSLSRPSPPTFSVGPAEPAPAGSTLVRSRTVTLDARHPDRWIRFDFSRGAAVADTGRGWDLAARRFRLIVNGGDGFPGEAGAVALERAVFDSVRWVPAGGYRPTVGGNGPDPEHPVLEEWYRYDFFSHLLLSRGTPFALRTADGRYAVVEVVSYYCPGPEPGCLTLRYHYQGDGTRRMTPDGQGD